jgi:hypothetical protein
LSVITVLHQDLENLEPDIWAAPHCEYFDLARKQGGAMPLKAALSR